MSDEQQQKPMSLEETLARLCGQDPGSAHIDWEFGEDVEGGLHSVFLKHDGNRACVFCKKRISPDPTMPAMEIETSDYGKLYIFFCSKYCTGAPKVQM